MGTVVETRTGTSREVGSIEAAESAVVAKAAVGTAAVEIGTGTSRKVDLEAAESAAVVEAEGGVIREVVVGADGKAFRI